jgi:hypothetical protein
VAPEDCDRLSDDDARIRGLESATITGALPDVARLAVAIENSYSELRSAAMGIQ